MQMQVGPTLSVGCRGRRAEAPCGGSPSAKSSVKPSSAANDNLIDRTIELWQPRLRRKLTREDARQITENVTGFFSLLAEWSKAEIATPASDRRYNPTAATPARCAMRAETIAKALGGRKVGGGWMARCPAHEDRNPSLSIHDADDGKVLVCCHAGCDQARVIEALRTLVLCGGIDRKPPRAIRATRYQAQTGVADRDDDKRTKPPCAFGVRPGGLPAHW